MALNEYMIVSTLVFGIGIFTVVSRRHLVGIIMGLVMMLSSVILNFAAFDRFSNLGTVYEGQAASLLTIAISVIEIILGMAIIVLHARTHKSVDSESAENLKG